MKGEIDKSTIIVGDFNAPLLIIARTTIQKTSKDMEELNNILNQQISVDIYTALHPTTTKYTFISSVYQDRPYPRP